MAKLPCTKIVFLRCNIEGFRVVIMGIALLALAGCSLTLYKNADLGWANWVVKTKTRTSQELDKRLSALNAGNSPVYDVSLINEKFLKRTIGVDENGRPSTYLHELQLVLIVRDSDKVLINEPIFNAREISPSEHSAQVDHQKEQMIDEMLNLILFRLSELYHQDKGELLEKNQRYNQLHNRE